MAPTTQLRRSAPLLVAALAACGGGQARPDRPADTLCEAGAGALRDRLGPELAGIVERVPVTAPAAGEGRPPAPLGCALVYTQVPEEMPEEGLPPEEVDVAGSDHRLAVVVPEPGEGPALHLVGPSAASPGPVMLTLSTRDLVGDARPELIVQEDAVTADRSWRGLRLFGFPGDGRPPREVLGEALRVETPEGLEMIAEWRTGDLGGRRVVVFEGAGTKRIFAWDEAAGRFAFDAAATAAHNPKPAAPPETAPAAGEKPAEGEKPAADLEIPLP